MDLPAVGLAGRLATGLWLWSRTWDSSDKLVLFGELADELSTLAAYPTTSCLWLYQCATQTHGLLRRREG